MSKRKAGAKTGKALKVRAGTRAKRPSAGAFDFAVDGDEHLDDEAVASEDEEIGAENQAEEDDEDFETPAEKRVRLAKQYLAQVEATMEEDDDDGGVEARNEDRVDALGDKLARDRLLASGQLRRPLADSLNEARIRAAGVTRLKGHKLPPTCVALSADEQHAFSGGKDGAVIRYNLETGVRKVLHPLWSRKCGRQAHEVEILAVTVSSDGRYLAAGGRTKEILVWDLRTDALVKTFTGHRDAVSGLAFRADSHALYSASNDRCLKHWNLDEMAYVETLYGHQSDMTGIDAWRKERPISCSRDHTVRVWKLVDESHLLFKIPVGTSIDCIAMLGEDSWLTGGEDGGLSVWSINKKKPLVIARDAHGGGNHWLTSVAAVKGSDLAASGSSDGYVRLWKATASAQAKSDSALAEIGSLPLPGFVNGLALGASGNLLVAAVGQEHRLGRWMRVKEAKNGVYVVRLNEASRAG